MTRRSREDELRERRDNPGFAGFGVLQPRTAATAAERGIGLRGAVSEAIVEADSSLNTRATGGQRGNKRLRLTESGESSIPDLSDLLPGGDDSSQFERSGASRNVPSIMNGGNGDGGDEPMQEAARMPGGDNMQSKETPISPYPTLTYGLQETHTTILPWTGWLSANELDYATPVQLPIRMNAIHDMVPITTGTDPAAGVSYPSKGLYGSKRAHNNGRSHRPFPATFASASTSPTERPQWREYWRQLYDYYTVLACHYEIVIHNPAQTGSFYEPVICGVQFDSYSDTATSTGNVMPQTRLIEALNYKNIRWYNIEGQSIAEQQQGDNNIQIVRGTYKPGMIKHNIVNDGDVKTWTKTDGTLPTLKDILTLNFWSHPFATATSSGASAGVNIQMNLTRS